MSQLKPTATAQDDLGKSGRGGGAAEGDEAAGGGADAAVRSFYVGVSADDPEVARQGGRLSD